MVLLIVCVILYIGLGDFLYTLSRSVIEELPASTRPEALRLAPLLIVIWPLMLLRLAIFLKRRDGEGYPQAAAFDD